MAIVVQRLHRSVVPVLACAGRGLRAGRRDRPGLGRHRAVAQTARPDRPRRRLVVLHGTVDAGHQKTTYWFEVGPTTAYGSTTQPVTLDKITRSP